MKHKVLQMLKFIDKNTKKLERFLVDLSRAVLKRIGRQTRGKKRSSLINALAGILYYIKSGCTWRGLPLVFGNYKTVYGWFCKLSKLDIFTQSWISIIKELINCGKLSLKKILIDGSLTSFHGGGQFAKNNPRNRNKKTINRVISVSSSGIPLSILLVPGTAHDTNFLEHSLDQIDENFKLPKIFSVHADKGFDSFKNRMYVRSKGGFPHIAARKYVQIDQSSISSKDKHRWKVERSIAWINRFKACTNIFMRNINHINSLFSIAFILISSRFSTSKNLKLALGAI